VAGNVPLEEHFVHFDDPLFMTYPYLQAEHVAAVVVVPWLHTEHPSPNTAELAELSHPSKQVPLDM
jgi:hypothetical protein